MVSSSPDESTMGVMHDRSSDARAHSEGHTTSLSAYAEELMTSWRKLIRQSLPLSVQQRIHEDRAAGHEILPTDQNRFTAFNVTPFDQVRVVILGQDPYPRPGHSHGLAFSVLPDVHPLPPTLRNIFQELRDDLDVPKPANGYLLPWAQQGVLLLNTALSVCAYAPGSHSKIGWEYLTRAVVQTLSTEHPHLVFVLWGNHAQKFVPYIDSRHTLITSAHPSPLSAHYGFFGSRPFSRVNAALSQPINWQL